jgi:CBS domain-containing protein
MQTVRNILDAKGKNVWSVPPDTTLLQALKLMAEKNVGAVLVIENEETVGIFSERDLARDAVEKPDLSLETQVRTMMITPVYAVSPDQSLDECISIMVSGHFRHLPVVENGRLIGLISIGDLVKQLISDRQSTIDSLEDYIWVNLI